MTELIDPIPRPVLCESTNMELLEFLRGSSQIPSLWIADPNWPYRQTGGGDRKKFRSTASRLYGQQEWDEIRATLAVASDVCRSDGLMALWVTTPLKMDIAERVVLPLKESGHWYYATSFYWHKDGAPGMGQWVRGDVEELQILACDEADAARIRNDADRLADIAGVDTGADDIDELWILARGQGKIPPRLKAQMQSRCDRNWYGCKRRELEHSEKPRRLEEIVIERFTLPGELVGSLWSGLFTTGQAALATGRACIGAEADAERYQKSVKRISGV